MYTCFYICCTDLYTRWRLTVFCFPFATTSSELRAYVFLILFKKNPFWRGYVTTSGEKSHFKILLPMLIKNVQQSFPLSSVF